MIVSKGLQFLNVDVFLNRLWLLSLCFHQRTVECFLNGKRTVFHMLRIDILILLLGQIQTFDPFFMVY